jgi:hypothetical protein
MARYSTSESSSDSSSNKSGDSTNRHNASEEEDGCDIDGGNVDNFLVVLLPLGFE